MFSRDQRGASLAGVVLVTMLAVACTEPTPNYCQKNSGCSGGRVCDVARATCVLPDTAVAPLDTAGESIPPVDAAMDAPVDVPSVNEAGPPIDASIPSDAGEPDAPVVDAALDAARPDTRLADAVVETMDAVGSCTVGSECTDPTKAFCVAGQCAGCQNAGATACGSQVCDAVSGKCVECTGDSQCSKDPAKRFCVANACTGCGAAGATGCSARTDGKTVCATSGTASGQCVECAADGQCTKDTAKGFCVANACTGCGTAGTTGCGARTDGKTVCATT
ncbi:MAG TPA: hypothetical protein VF518_01895, partial [Polyangia bacterium]